MGADRKTVDMFNICAGEMPSAAGCSYIAFSQIVGSTLCRLTGEECARSIDIANNLLGFTEADEATSPIKCGAAVVGLTTAGTAEILGAIDA